MQNTNPQQALLRDGFTLVELLVVIGIIAVLISVLLPVLASARESANKVKCLSNMKQIGLAYLMYAQNNKGVFPCFMTYIPASKGGPMWVRPRAMDLSPEAFGLQAAPSPPPPAPAPTSAPRNCCFWPSPMV